MIRERDTDHPTGRIPSRRPRLRRLGREDLLDAGLVGLICVLGLGVGGAAVCVTRPFRPVDADRPASGWATSGSSPTTDPMPSPPVPPSGGHAATATGTATATRPAQPFCTYSYTHSSWYGLGFSANIGVTNLSGTDWDGWQVTLSWSPTATVTNSWGGTVDVTGLTARITPADYDRFVARLQSVSVGFIGKAPAGTPSVSGLSVHGHACRRVAASVAAR